MKRGFIGAMLVSLVHAAAADDTGIPGTHWVQFQPSQIAGELQGCSLIYMAVHPDYVYRSGSLTAVNGSIALQIAGQDQRTLGLMLKIGLRDITRKGGFERPHFAYLQTATGSTAKSQQESTDGEDGYKLFIYNAMSPDGVKVLGEMVSDGKITVGYQRSKAGLDVLVPIDLRVVDSDYSSGDKVVRRRSIETLTNFAECVSKVLGRLQAKIK